MVPGAEVTTSNIQCYTYNKWRYITNNCYEPYCCVTDSNSSTCGNGGHRGLHFALTCLFSTHDGQNSVIKDTWMILYTESMAFLTKNELFVNDVHQCLADDMITVMTNVG